MPQVSYKEKVLKIYPNAKCVWRDGARILYQIFDDKIPLTDQYCLSAKSAWRNAFVTLFQKSVTKTVRD